MNSNVKTDSWAPVAFSTAMLLACVLVVSHAYADDEARSETVKFADLNVGTPAGVETLYGRIHAAAQRVCPEPDIRELAHMARAKACITKAESEAIEKVNLPLLTAYYQKKTGSQPERLSANR